MNWKIYLRVAADSDVLGETTDNFMDSCIDRPDAQALETMRKQFNPTS